MPLPFSRLIELVDLVRPVVHPLLDKDGELRQISRLIGARKREYEARNLAQSEANNPGQADGTDNDGGDSAVEGVDVGPGPGTGSDAPGGFLQDALDWFQNLF